MRSEAGAGAPDRSRVPRWSGARGTTVAVVAIWVAVALASAFSPDLIHGSEQEHLPIAAITWWFWGAIATAFALVPSLARHPSATERREAWFALASTTTGIWLLAALLSIFTERRVTGSDPTQFPVAAVAAPIIAMVATGIVAAVVAMRVHRGSAESAG
jgi:hypothetical protein